MSEADNVWRVDIGGAEHEIELERTLSGKHTIKVDRQVVVEGGWRQMLRWGSTDEFEVAGQQAKIKIDPRYAGFAYGSSLNLDGRYVEPLMR